MAEQNQQEEKTEEPTPKRRQEARDEGQVAKSMELNSVAVLLAGMLSLYMFRYSMYNGLAEMMRVVFQEMIHIEINTSNCWHYFKIGAAWFLGLLGPVLLILFVVALLINYVQIGWLFTLKAIAPKMSKINPIKGIQNLVSMSKLFELVKNIMKITVIGVVAYLTIKDHIGVFYGLSHCAPVQIFKVLFNVILKIGIRIALVLVVLAIIDFIYQRHKNEEQLKMTKQEVKEERKQAEGDPQVKSRIKAIQSEMARKRMMDDVPKATVVITNPTYIAIALRYNMHKDKAPIVLAKGKRKIAEKIKEIAKENDIPIVEDKPLARGMYDLIQISDEIPEEYFTPVAEILAYVYKLKGKAA